MPPPHAPAQEGRQQGSVGAPPPHTDAQEEQQQGSVGAPPPHAPARQSAPCGAEQVSQDGISEDEEEANSDNENFSELDDGEKTTRGETHWPTDCVTVNEVDEQGIPVDEEIHKRFSKVCGLTARQKVPITLRRFKDLKDDKRKQLFTLYIQKYVAFPQSMEKKAIKLSMGLISRAWRRFKYNLGEMWRNGRDPFQTYKELSRDDWNTFIERLNTEQAKKASKKMSNLRKRHGEHHLGRDGYKGKKKKWEKEDEELARAGVENVWKKFPGRTEPYMRARAVFNRETGEITFLSSEASDVAQKVLSATSEGSVTGCRENDLLSHALGTPEQRGRVRGVGSYVGWRAGFPDDAETFRKRKSKSDNVDYDAITRHVLSALRPALSEQGIDIPEDLVLNFAATNDPRSSHASVDCEVDQSDQFCNIVREEEAMPLENFSNTIGQLNEPTRCRLMMSLGPMTVEVGSGYVYPQDMFINEDVPIKDGFAAVRVEMVHENMLDAELEVPLDDDIKTLRHAQHAKVQWRRSLIITESTQSTSAPPPPPPPKKSTTSLAVPASIPENSIASAPPSKKSAPCAARAPQPKKSVPAAAPPLPPQPKKSVPAAAPPLPPQPQKLVPAAAPPLPPQPQKSVPAAAPPLPPHKSTSCAALPHRPAPHAPEAPVKKPPTKKSSANKKKPATKKATTQPKDKMQVARAYVMDNPSYKPGEAMLTETELKVASENIVKLHDYYMKMYKTGKQSIIVQYMKKHFLTESKYFLVSWGDLYDLFHFSMWDVSIMRCWALHMMQHNGPQGKDGVGILDPGFFTTGHMDFSREEVVQGVVKAMNRFPNGLVLCAYNPGGHWMLVAFSMKRDEVFYFDSSRPIKSDCMLGVRDFSKVSGILNDALEIHLKELTKNNKTSNASRRVFIHHYDYKCPQQPPLSGECGWYVANNIAYVSNHPNIHMNEMSYTSPPPSELMDIRERLCKFIFEEIINEKGEFSYNPLRRD